MSFVRSFMAAATSPFLIVGGDNWSAPPGGRASGVLRPLLNQLNRVLSQAANIIIVESVEASSAGRMGNMRQEAEGFERSPYENTKNFRQIDRMWFF